MSARPGGKRPASFSQFFELCGRLGREQFIARFADPFLATEVNTDPRTWARARIVPLAKASKATAAASSEVTIGRDHGCDVILEGSSVSKRHAQVSKRDESFWITDLGSSNGTFLDGAELPSNRPTKIARAPARLAFGPQAIFMFFTPETLFEFLSQIRRAHGISEWSGEELGGVTIRAGSTGVDDAFARVLAIARTAAEASAAAAPLPTIGSVLPGSARTRIEKLVTDEGSVAATDEERFDESIRALESFGDMLDAITVRLDTAPDPCTLFLGGTKEQRAHAIECVRALRGRIVSLRPSLSIGDRASFELYVKR